MSLPIATQVRLAFQKQNRIEAIAGLFFGGYVPVAIWEFVHYELTGDKLWLQPKAYFVLAGLVVSLITVVSLAQSAFDNWFKSVGFAVLTEGAMAMSSNIYLSLSGLLLLIVINGLSAACLLALKKQEVKAEKKTKLKVVKETPPVSPTWAARNTKKEVKP